MFKLTRLMILLAVATLVAQPVMACCLTGHVDAAAEAQMTAEPCHDTTEAMDPSAMDTSHDMQGPMDCPGCLDCDAASMQAQSIDDSGLLTQSPSEVPMAVLSAKFEGFGHESIVYKTGPPSDPRLPFPTPVTLKQRLLI